MAQKKETKEKKRRKGGRPKAKKPAKGKAKPPSTELLNYRQMQALSKKERVRVLAVLCERVASPKEIAKELREPLNQVSYHVRVLRECRLIELDHEVPVRGAVEHFYRAAHSTLIPPGAWSDLPAPLKASISANIVEEFLGEASAASDAGVFDSAPGELSLTPLILDSRGVEEFGQIAREFLDSVLKLQVSVSKRMSKATGKAIDPTTATVFLASFLSARNPNDGKKAPATKRR